jgi:hypothetical protein
MSKIESDKEKKQSIKPIAKKIDFDGNKITQSETEKPRGVVVFLSSDLSGAPEVIDVHDGTVDLDATNSLKNDTESENLVLQSLYFDSISPEINCKQQKMYLKGSGLISKLPEIKCKTTLRERIEDKKNSMLSRTIFLINLFFLKKKYTNFFTNIYSEIIPEDVFQAKVLNLTKFNRNRLMKKYGISEDELNFIAFARFSYPFITRGEKEWSKIEKNADAFIARKWITEDIKGNFKINVSKVYTFREKIIFPNQFKDIVIKKAFNWKILNKILRKVERSAKTQVHVYTISQISKLPFTQFGNSNITTHPPISKNDEQISSLIKKKPIEAMSSLNKKNFLK